jgi:hypothetical protein
MNSTERNHIQKLLKLAEVSQEFEFVDLKLTDHWTTLREQYGLSKLLLLIKEYAEQQQNRNRPEAHQVSQPSSNPDVVL